MTTNTILKRLGLYGGESADTAIDRLDVHGPRIWTDWEQRMWTGRRVAFKAELDNRLRPVSAREVVAATVLG